LGIRWRGSGGGHACGDEIHAWLAWPLKRHGKAYEFHRYDSAGHGFFYYQTPMYRSEAAMDGWEKVFSFFGRHLKS
jgi:dienelactone hydrolase